MNNLVFIYTEIEIEKDINLHCLIPHEKFKVQKRVKLKVKLVHCLSNVYKNTLKAYTKRAL